MSAPPSSRLDRMLGRSATRPYTVEAAWIERIGFVAALAVLLALSLPNLGHLSFWNDEVASIRFAKGSLPDLLAVINRPIAVDTLNMYPYYLILHFWLQLGETEARLRVLSIILGLAAVVPVFLTARRIAGPWAGTVAALLFVTNAYVVSWSQQVRGYTMEMLAAGAMTYLLLRAVDSPSTRAWAVYTVAAVIGLYVEVFSVFLIAAHLLWVVAARRLPTQRRTWLLVCVPIVVALVPLALNFTAHGERIDWLLPITIHGINAALEILLGGSLLVAAVLVVLGFVALDRLRTDSRVWLLLASAVVPVVLAIAVSLVKDIWNPRYLVLILPAASCLAAVGLVSIRPNRARLALAVLTAVVVLTSLPVAYQRQTTDWHAAMAWMRASNKRGDRIIVIGDGSEAPGYYLARLRAVPRRTTPDAANRHPHGGQLWVATRSVSRTDRLLLYGRLSDRYHRIATSEFDGGLVVALFVPNRAHKAASH